MKFIVYDKDGKISRTGHCQPATFNKQAGQGESIIEAVANDVRQKVVKGKIVNKTSEEIKRDSPKTPPKPTKDKKANITNRQYDDLLARIEAIERVLSSTISTNG